MVFVVAFDAAIGLAGDDATDGGGGGDGGDGGAGAQGMEAVRMREKGDEEERERNGGGEQEWWANRHQWILVGIVIKMGAWDC